MDDALQQKLDRIERRQWYILVLLLYPYLAGGTWLATESPFLAAAAAALAIVVTAYLVTLVRARTTSSGDDAETETATE
jgi:ABC-type multidrug transport system permease subunit